MTTYSVQRLALWGMMFLAGAGLGEKMLLQEHEMHAATTVCGHAKYIRIVWSTTAATDHDYADDGAFITDCSDVNPEDVAPILDAMANPPNPPTADEVNAQLRQITADDAKAVQ
jgi:hypothetical protein